VQAPKEIMMAAVFAPPPFPISRPRRLRNTAAVRSLVRETHLQPSQLIYPLFVVAGSGVRNPVPSMPGVFQLSVDQAVVEAQQVARLGLGGLMLFGVPGDKDLVATGAWHDHGLIQQATRAIKQAVPEVLVIADTCLCEYTSHGHCGALVEGDRSGRVVNDPTLQILARTVVSQAQAGADMIAPSGMMDGMVATIRAALDDAGFEELPIMSYAAKYASAYYGPFRDAAQSAPQFGDRRSYQMDPANRREALKEVGLDVAEGADIVMVKPALAYLDLVWQVKQLTQLPVAAYNVSGEYAMIKAAGQNGWIDEQRIVLETLTSMRRAGADIILTYFAKDVVEWL
jgi:porphobilinogen synthase